MPQTQKTPPKLSPLGNRKWRLEDDFYWMVGAPTSGLKIKIPRGFIFDGASSPWFSWLIIRPDDPQVMTASLVHDYLYRDEGFTKVVADAIFYEVLREQEFPRWRAIIAYISVRLANRWR